MFPRVMRAAPTVSTNSGTNYFKIEHGASSTKNLTDLTPRTDFASILSTPDGTAPAPFTVFAPTNDAFGALLMDLGLTALSEVPVDVLAATLELHVIPGANVRAEDLAGIDGTNVSSLGGGVLTIDAGAPAIIDPDGGSNPIIVTNVQAANGVIHAVSRVLRDL